ncbi:MAG: flippase-like domain-containing protein [Pirellulales bacterium]|nr:flippase-like domain-containing protein [Pirellulales bacterium]
MANSIPSRRFRKWLLPAVKVLIVLLVAWFIRDTLQEACKHFDWKALRFSFSPHPSPLPKGEGTSFSIFWMFACGGTYLLGLLPAGLYWRHVLRALGQEARLGETLRAYYVGHLGKYVPGKAMVVILRTGLIRSHRIDTAVAAVSVFYETLTMMAVGACLAAAVVAYQLRGEHVLFWGSLAMMAVAGLPTLPPVFRLVTRALRLGRLGEATQQNLDRLGYRTLLYGWFSMTVLWIIMALSLWTAFRAVGVTQFDFLDHVPEFLAAVALAVVGGFLSFIPGGLGVRDLLLVELLDKLFRLPAAPATLASALLRLVWLVAELLIFAILYFRTWLRSMGKRL